MKINVMLDEKAYMPQKAHIEDAGFDIFSPDNFVAAPRGYCIIDTGVHMQIPAGYVGFLKSKSGLNVKHGLTSEGVIDSGYTGSIVAKIYNSSNEEYRFTRGDKITQIVILPIPEVELEQVSRLEDTARGTCGFGSTGK